MSHLGCTVGGLFFFFFLLQLPLTSFSPRSAAPMTKEQVWLVPVGCQEPSRCLGVSWEHFALVRAGREEPGVGSGHQERRDFPPSPSTRGRGGVLRKGPRRPRGLPSAKLLPHRAMMRRRLTEPKGESFLLFVTLSPLSSGAQMAPGASNLRMPAMLMASAVNPAELPPRMFDSCASASSIGLCLAGDHNKMVGAS